MRTPELDAAIAGLRSRYGLPAPGTEAVVTLRDAAPGTGRVVGRFVDVVVEQLVDDLVPGALILDAGDTRTVVPWHAVSTVNARRPGAPAAASHPAL